MKKVLSVLAVFVFLIASGSYAGNFHFALNIDIATKTVAAQPISDSGKIRVIMIGAHPDDCDRTEEALLLFLQKWDMLLNS